MAREYIGGRREFSSITYKVGGVPGSVRGGGPGTSPAVAGYSVTEDSHSEFTKPGPTVVEQGKSMGKRLGEAELLDEVWPDECKLCHRYYYGRLMAEKHGRDAGICEACLQEVLRRLEARKYQST